MFHSHTLLHFTICREAKITTHLAKLCQQILPKPNLAVLVRPPLGGVYVSEIWCNCRRCPTFLTVKSVLYVRLKPGVR